MRNARLIRLVAYRTRRVPWVRRALSESDAVQEGLIVWASAVARYSGRPAAYYAGAVRRQLFRAARRLSAVHVPRHTRRKPPEPHPLPPLPPDPRGAWAATDARLDLAGVWPTARRHLNCRLICVLRFRVVDCLTLKQIAERWGLSKERIRGLQASAVCKLRARKALDAYRDYA